jgi:urea transport system permease protein
MFSDYSMTELTSIFAMQGFAGLILFSIFVLMALGLAIIFGQTLLATWGLSLILQQLYRTVFGAREVGVTLPDWMMGSYPITDLIEVPINGIFVMVLTIIITLAVYLMMQKSSLGKQTRAVVQNRQMAGAVGINTEKVDRYTFGIGCGIAGVAGSAFTMIGSTGPTAGQAYIVDTFLVVVFGGASSLLGTVASAFTISQAQSTMEFFLSGSMAKVLTLLTVVGILMLRPQGLFSLKIRR